MDNSKRGVYGKFIISKADGSDVDPEACYFILRLDTDEAARRAAEAYADATDDLVLAADLVRCIEEIEQGPCGCREACCPHVPLVPARWRHGDGYIGVDEFKEFVHNRVRNTRNA